LTYRNTPKSGDQTCVKKHSSNTPKYAKTHVKELTKYSKSGDQTCVKELMMK
jgi:hypothetical protein